ncbi:hypothetical protein C8F04DRAFT_1189721 [Mycena alexandri]|uniref:Uncharacterized protein n=1 Tax=Mycena alexandri TaxID=1745969 RepID=A0AAD6SG22_9AGAR|nr:hypothetical protein C8F04DRAFT_1189721 [Mycena alexandri]
MGGTTAQGKSAGHGTSHGPAAGGEKIWSVVPTATPATPLDQKGFISGIWAPFGLPKGLLQSLHPGLSACEVGATSEPIKFVLSAYWAACRSVLVWAFAYWAAHKSALVRAFGGRLGWYWAC